MIVNMQMDDVLKKIICSGKNEINFFSIKSAFLLPKEALLALSFEVDGGAVYLPVCVRGHEEYFQLPPDCQSMLFIVESKMASRPMTPMETEKERKALTVSNRWQTRVFQIQGGKFNGTCFLINGQRVLTAAHLDFVIDKKYQICGSEKRTFDVKCKFICCESDFAVLHSDELPDLSPPVDGIYRGMNYFVMGYPADLDHTHPAISKGIIEGLTADNTNYVGTPGSKRGYSGAPVFNDGGSLVGMLLGSTSTL
ncbi:unnamed protein product, partial [Auanema sp. JU1783]